MSETDNITNNVGQNVPENIPSETPVVESPTSSFSDNDVQEILEENGFSSSDAPNEEDADDSQEVTLDEGENESQETDDEGPETIADTSKIPLNSPTLLVDESTTRFSGAEWFSEIQKAKVIIAGVGGIGSNVAFQLARMVPAGMVLYDDDRVERLNMAGQLYSYSDIGKTKVDAMIDRIASYTSMRGVLGVNAKFTASTEPGDIMICGFDNMAARSVFFQSWVRHEEEKSKCLYLDGRLSMDTLQILCVRGDDDYNINRYREEYLFSDSQADSTICSRKQTTYLACMIGSLMVNLFTNFIANTLNPVIPYDLPFFTEYDAQNMLFKTES